MRTYIFNNQTIEVELRPFGIFLWLLMGFEVRTGGRSFLPKPNRVGLNTETEFELEVEGNRVSGVVRSLGPIWFIPRMSYTVCISGIEIARDRQTLRRWYLPFLAAGAVGVFVLLALLGAMTLAMAISMAFKAA